MLPKRSTEQVRRVTRRLSRERPSSWRLDGGRSCKHPSWCRLRSSTTRLGGMFGMKCPWTSDRVSALHWVAPTRSRPPGSSERMGLVEPHAAQRGGVCQPYGGHRSSWAAGEEQAERIRRQGQPPPTRSPHLRRTLATPTQKHPTGRSPTADAAARTSSAQLAAVAAASTEAIDTPRRTRLAASTSRPTSSRERCVVSVCAGSLVRTWWPAGLLRARRGFGTPPVNGAPHLAMPGTV